MRHTFTDRESPDRESPRREPPRRETFGRVPFLHVCVRRIRPARHLIALGALSALLLAGCSDGGSDPSTAGNSTGGTSTEGRATGGSAPAQDGSGANSASGAKDIAPGTARKDGATAGQGDVPKPGTPVTGVAPKLSKNASLDVQVKDITAAAARVRAIAAGLQAEVLSEQIGKGGPAEPTPEPMPMQGDSKQSPETGDPSGFGTLTLSVPADKLDAAMDQLSKIGTVQRRNTSSQDVTSQYVDTQSRLKTMRASVERVRALMAQAKDIGQVVALESELSQREADLESMESQLEGLRNSVARSPLTISLSTPVNEPVADNGFVAGLRSGWDAFTASASGLLTAIGAVLPFAAFLAMVGASFLWWWRRRRTSPEVKAEANA